MTNQEAQALLDEARTTWPRFMDGRRQYTVTPEGAVNVWVAVGKSGQRWSSAETIRPDRVMMARWLPARVRARAEEARQAAGVAAAMFNPFTNHHTREIHARRAERGI